MGTSQIAARACPGRRGGGGVEGTAADYLAHGAIAIQTRRTGMRDGEAVVAWFFPDTPYRKRAATALKQLNEAATGITRWTGRAEQHALEGHHPHELRRANRARERLSCGCCRVDQAHAKGRGSSYVPRMHDDARWGVLAPT